MMVVLFSSLASAQKGWFSFVYLVTDSLCWCWLDHAFLTREEEQDIGSTATLNFIAFWGLFSVINTCMCPPFCQFYSLWPSFPSQILTDLGFSIYWDIWQDWGLMKRGSANFLLRDQITYPKPV
jgi:hypothetical protein